MIREALLLSPVDELFFAVSESVEYFLQAHDVEVGQEVLAEVRQALILEQLPSELGQTWQHEHVLSQ